MSGAICPLIFFVEDKTINIKDIEINERIRDSEVRVIDENGVQLGIMSAMQANRIADEKNLDLVKISPTVVPPVCKIMDYGKSKFDAAKKKKMRVETKRQAS